MRNPFLVGSVILLLGAFPAFSQGPLISHEAASCVPTEGFPRFTADIAGDLATPPRLYFRCDPLSSDFYYVEMSMVSPTETGGLFEALLPTPLQPPCNNLTYYMEAVDNAYTPFNTPEASPGVTRGACAADSLPPGSSPPSIAVFAANGTPVGAVPGFASTGILPVAGAGIATGGGSILSNPLFWGLVGAGTVTTSVIVATTGQDDVSPTTP